MVSKARFGWLLNKTATHSLIKEVIMNGKYINTIMKWLDILWAENDIYIYLFTLFILAAIGLSYLCVTYYTWMFNLIEEDNERTYYLTTARRGRA